MQTYVIDGYRIAARSQTQAQLSADLLRKYQLKRDACRGCGSPLPVNGTRCRACTGGR